MFVECFISFKRFPLYFLASGSVFDFTYENAKKRVSHKLNQVFKQL